MRTDLLPIGFLTAGQPGNRLRRIQCCRPLGNGYRLSRIGLIVISLLRSAFKRIPLGTILLGGAEKRLQVIGKRAGPSDPHIKFGFACIV
jgi:hypothetical protein